MHLTDGMLTRKITMTVARIALGKSECLYLGNIYAKQDWGHARDYVEGKWRMLQQDTPDHYVLVTGETRTVLEFVEKAFLHVGITIQWSDERATVVERSRTDQSAPNTSTSPNSLGLTHSGVVVKALFIRTICAMMASSLQSGI
eukprot:scaffold1201_cov199-Alexandrium_tamarense.AAC.6